MIVEVFGNNVDVAFKRLGKKMQADGIDRQLKIHQIPKPSEKRKLKEHLAERRRLRNQGRKAWYREARREGRYGRG
jgi:ribosomal protein S21